MSINVRINLLDTITYRTDCLAAQSFDRYHLRKAQTTIRDPLWQWYSNYNKGYEKNIGSYNCVLPDRTNINIDIGHNPVFPPKNQYTIGSENPIICDKLIIDGMYTGIDFFYEQLIFEKSAFSGFLYTSEVYDYSQWWDLLSFSSPWHFSWDRPDFLLIDKLYAVAQPANSGFYISGKLWNTSAQEYIEFQDQRIAGFRSLSSRTPDYSYINGDEAFITFSSVRAKESDACNSLDNIIRTGDSVSRSSDYSGRWNIQDYNQLRYVRNDLLFCGCMALPLTYITCVLKRGSTYYVYYPTNEYSFMGLTCLQPARLLDILYVPFLSMAEYHAAIAALFRWDDEDKQDVIDAVNQE